MITLLGSDLNKTCLSVKKFELGNWTIPFVYSHRAAPWYILRLHCEQTIVSLSSA